jgi:D-arabinose 1-dehydrogenase-like Zn-dependent alcohol dehydrogenase
MQAVIVEKPGAIEVCEVADPAPAPDEVVVSVGACGICGTDVHIVDGDSSLAVYPVVPGHEFAGEVVAAGREVEGLAVGTIVSVDPNRHCGRCGLCREAHGNLCRNLVALGVTVAGACAEFVAVLYWLAGPLPHGFRRRDRRLRGDRSRRGCLGTGETGRDLPAVRGWPRTPRWRACHRTGSTRAS